MTTHQATVALGAAMIVLLCAGSASSQSRPQPSVLTPADDAIVCAAIERINEISLEMTLELQGIPGVTPPPSPARAQMLRRQITRLNHAYGTLQEMKRRSDPPGTGGPPTGGIARSPLGSQSLMITLYEECMTDPVQPSSKRYYSSPDIRGRELILISPGVLNRTGPFGRVGQWSIDTIAYALVHEAQRLSRSICFLRTGPGVGGGTPPPNPLPPVWWLWTATDTYGILCLEEQLLELDGELLNYLIGQGAAARGWTAEEKRNADVLAEKVVRRGLVRARAMKERLR